MMHTPLSQRDLESLARGLAQGKSIRLHQLTIGHHCGNPYILRVITQSGASYFWFTSSLVGRWNLPKVKIETVLKYHLSILEFLNRTPQIIEETHRKLGWRCVYYFRPVQSTR